jgi:hypothetical protein
VIITRRANRKLISASPARSREPVGETSRSRAAPIPTSRGQIIQARSRGPDRPPGFRVSGQVITQLPAGNSKGISPEKIRSRAALCPINHNPAIAARSRDPDRSSGFSVSGEVITRLQPRDGKGKARENSRSRAGPLPDIRGPAIRARSRDPDGSKAANLSGKITSKQKGEDHD